MQLTGASGAQLGRVAALRWSAAERRIRNARALSPAAEAGFVRPQHLGGQLARFLAEFFASDWPLIAGAVLLALLATTLLRGRGYMALLPTTISIALAVAIVNWLRMRHYLSEHPHSFYPTRELWIDAGWYAVYLAVIAGAVYGITLFRWSPGVQVAAAVGVAVLLPPAVTVTMLFVGCYFFAACP